MAGFQWDNTVVLTTTCTSLMLMKKQIKHPGKLGGNEHFRERKKKSYLSMSVLANGVGYVEF